MNHTLQYFIQILPQRKDERYYRVDSVKPEIRNIINAMDWCWQHNKLEKFIDLAEKMDFYLWLTGDWGTWNYYVELGLEAAVSLGNEHAQAKFLELIASMRDFQHDLDEAERYIKKAIMIYRKYEDKREVAMSTWRLGSIQIKKEEYKIGKKTLEQALAIAKEVNDIGAIVRIQGRLGVIDIHEGNYNSAQSRLEDTRKLRGVIHDYR